MMTARSGNILSILSCLKRKKITTTRLFKLQNIAVQFILNKYNTHENGSSTNLLGRQQCVLCTLCKACELNEQLNQMANHI